MDRVPLESLDYPGDGLYYLNDQPFTGTSFSLHPPGTLAQETEYREGMSWGTTRSWDPLGRLEHESANCLNVHHGLVREWNDAGRLITLASYEWGICLWRQKWNDSGTLIENWSITPTDSLYNHLMKERLRALQVGHDKLAPPPPQLAP